MLGFQDVDLAALDDPALAAHLGGVFTLAREGLRLHFELINIAGAFGRYLVRVREWGLDPNVAMAAVMHGVPVHAEAHERMMAIVDSMEGTSVPSLDAVRSHSTVAARALDEYLRFHGSWATTDDANAPTLAEQPSVLLRAIANHRPPPAVDADARRSVRSEVPTADQAEFDRLSDEAQQAHAAMEDNSALLGSWPLGLLGRAMREAARRLAASGRLPDEDSVWALTSPEVAGLLDGSTSLDRPSIEARVRERAALIDLDPPRHLNGEPGSPPDSSVFPEPVAYWTDAMGTFIEAKMHTTQATGVGTAPVTGRAVVVESAHEAFERIEPGDILVTRATNPAFNAIMPMLGGLITTDGGPACHAAVVARELQLSAIIGLGDALDRLPDHATIRLDPQRASVTVVEAEATA
ncbi:MAG: PEP-utilizing enzyme [Acidimicrobiales bacterium]